MSKTKSTSGVAITLLIFGKIAALLCLPAFFVLWLAYGVLYALILLFTKRKETAIVNRHYAQKNSTSRFCQFAIDMLNLLVDYLWFIIKPIA